MITKEKIVDLITGEETIIEREMSEVEIAELNATLAAQQAEAAEQAAKEAARQALLDKLGITAEEAALLLG